MTYPTIDFGTPPGTEEIDALARQIYPEVFRRSLRLSGVALIRFLAPISSIDLRRTMIALKQALSNLHQERTGQYLVYQSMMRFDQQGTTRFHLDGGPEESYLMLGYEPSEVQSALAIADLAHVVFEQNLSPDAFLTEFNPLFPKGEQALTPYVTRLDTFDSRYSQIVIINNSRLAYTADEKNSLGVLHQATVLPQPEKHRIINSTMFVPATDLGSELIGVPEQETYTTTTVISGY